MNMCVYIYIYIHIIYYVILPPSTAPPLPLHPPVTNTQYGNVIY